MLEEEQQVPYPVMQLENPEEFVVIMIVFVMMVRDPWLITAAHVIIQQRMIVRRTV